MASSPRNGIIVKVEQVIYMLMAQDMERAVAFYRDVVGLTVKSQSLMWSELAFGDATIALHGGGAGDFNKTGLGFQVSDIDAACQEVLSGGGQVLSGPTDRPGEPIKLAHLADTEGNGFSFSQYTG